MTGTEEFSERTGLDLLPAHLEHAYGISVTRLTELDLGVFRVERRKGPDWVARVSAAGTPVEAVEGDGGILRFLAHHDFPAERCAAAPAVTVHHRQAVLVTEYVPGSRPDPDERTFYRLGDLLGRLHTLPAESGLAARPGGAWHHLTSGGGPRAEIDAAIGLLAAARPRVPAAERAGYEELLGELRGGEDGHGLPQALIHPDFGPANAVAGANGGLTLVDWAGAGRGPRLWSLGFLLWVAGARDLAVGPAAVVAGYRAHVRLERGELERLAGAIRIRPVIFGCWGFCTGRKALADAVRELPAIRERAGVIAARAVQAFADDQLDAVAARLSAVPGAGSPAGLPEGVGVTGLAVAAVRAEETARPDRLFADPLAAAFVAGSGWTPPARGDRRALVLRVWVVARTVFLDELLVSACQDGCRQVVILGAGFDARAFRLPWPPGVRCFELDTAAVLDVKTRVLSAAAAQPSCERIPVVADLREDWPGPLLAAGFAPGQPTAWIAEGLLVYLTADDVDAVMADLTALSAPGSRLGLTMSSLPPSGVPGVSPGSPMLSLRRSGAPEDPVRWLAGHGWAGEITSPLDVLRAHGRPVPSANPARPSRARGLLLAATRDATPSS